MVEEANVWLAKMNLLDKAGYGLWVEGEPDSILGVDENVFLFRNQQALFDFVLSDAPCNVSGFQDYKLFRIASVKWLNTQALEVFEYNFNRVSLLLSNSKPNRWRQEVRSDILTSLNMIWDLANTVKDAWSIEQMHGEAEGWETPLLGGLMDTLTFTSDDELYLFEKFDMETISRIYQEILSRLANRVLIMPLS